MTRDATERTDAVERGQRTQISPFLFLVMEGARLAGGGMRVALSSTRRLKLGRGDQRALHRGKSQDATLTVPDPRMSGEHAVITGDGHGFYVEDSGSTNGTLVDGAPLAPGRRHPLADGALLELGQTIFLFREIASDVAHAADREPEPGEAAGTTTLDPELARRFGLLVKVAASPISVLVHGETGTGKEVLARAVHELSARPGAFVAVNCGAIPPNLVESHLFGHVRGSFSGAIKDEVGLVRSAHQGTLLLDEIGDLPLASQAALLRVLQEGEVLPVGSTQAARVDVRVLAATHMPLDRLIEEGNFRRDLYARLAGYVFTLPPLRERKVDLGLLIASMLASGALLTPRGLRIHREALGALVRHDWPMNVRELAQCLRAAAALAEDGLVTLEQLPESVLRASPGEPPPTEALTEEDEKLHRELLARFAEAKGNVSEVARAMGKARQQIQRWVRRFSIDTERFR